MKKAILIGGCLLAMSTSPLAQAARLVKVTVLDELHLMVVVQDSKVHYTDDGKGPNAFMGHESSGPDSLEVFGKPLDTESAALPQSYSIQSTSDPHYGLPTAPQTVFRKSKVSGTAWGWPEPRVSIEHTLFLRLPQPLTNGKSYRLSLDPSLQVDTRVQNFDYDITKSVSEAIKVNLIGYHSTKEMKSADLYMWIGSGGARDYSSFVGRKVWILDLRSGKRSEVGTVKFWKESGPNSGGWDTTKSPVWNIDFSDFSTPGKYRLVVDGVGSSHDFEIKDDIYWEPFRTSLLGFYYMRIGEPKDGVSPPPRQPRFIPNVDPPGFKVYLTTMSPWHPEWKTLPGDAWDVKDWSKWKEPGEPTNNNAFGGHSDALDWDRHAGHVSIIYDMLMPYILTNGRGGEDNTGILESGNGIPDAIDEARNEVDFWLRLRDTKGGYSAGLNNPSPDHKVMYQAGTKPYMAWVSAANAAMLGDAFRIAKRQEEADFYRDQALEAWRIADEQDLDLSHSIGNGKIQGRDLKQIAAASLYNLTGEKRYEDILLSLGNIKDDKTPTEIVDKSNQLWGTAIYLSTALHRWRPIQNQERVAMMKAAIIYEAKTKNVANSSSWPTRRCTDNAFGWFQTITEVQRVCVAHAISTNPEEKSLFHRALILEADYSLGRNPLNLALMTGIGTRHVDDIYTSGRNDGFPGVHPGHTPYMNAEPWGPGFMADPKWMANQGFPAWSEWPHGEAFWPARYCYANNEFTPQQSMRGKHFLYHYLYAIGTPVAK
ncbi:MAG: glycoside hydrolase family 9 protein [Fimbriimonadaceae bacterium]|nr:glycoside hydrolase family 9 protein [Fimbriimonadaceae bacterium]